MKESIGFIVDFKKPCETIMSYSFNKKAYNDDIFGDIMIEELAKLNGISKKDIDFTKVVTFEEEPEFEDVFCKSLGEYIKSKFKTEFPWNLFFKILFEIEPYNNKQDFENFIMFIKEKVMSFECQAQLMKQFGKESDNIIRDIYACISDAIIKADSVETLYDYNLENINYLASEIVSYICRDFDDYQEYLEGKNDITKKLEYKIVQIFE